MRLVPVAPEITLYETGFGTDDPFNRIGTGKSLSELVERIEDPLVIALDGEWGCGKTWFLKRWVGAHGKENNGRATTVYFDAFAHDFMDDPLIGLTGVIGERLPKNSAGAWGRVKTAAVKLARPAARVGLAVATGGVTEVLGPVLDVAAEATRKEFEVAAEAFWARENGKRAAMQQLRDALVSLTAGGTEKDEKPVPLVVVVDELDRCRPDYALALLEVVKHFFSVPNVHFVLGVSLEALGHSVRARYGAGINAERYLRKFISISARLPDQTGPHDTETIVRNYFERTSELMGISKRTSSAFCSHIDMYARNHTLTMRDVDQMLRRLAMASSEKLDRRPDGWRDILASMILFNLNDQKLERKAIDGTISLEDIRSFYGIDVAFVSEVDRDGFDRCAEIISGLWEYIITNGSGPQVRREMYAAAFDKFGLREPRNVPRMVHSEHLANFILLDRQQ